MEYLLAHDLGTTGNKAVLFTTDGSPVAREFCAYPTAYPAPGFAEQSADAWWAAVVTAGRRLIERSGIDAGRIAVVSFSGQMMGCLPVGRDGTPLRESIIWADLRATEQADELARGIPPDVAYGITGHRISASYGLPKLMWVRDHEPDLFKQTAMTLNAKEYAVWQLTGEMVTDFSDAGGTGAFDLRAHRWSHELLGAAGIRESLFPDAVPSTTVIGAVTESASRLTGLRAGTPVVIGGGDGACATIGAGAVHDGDAYNVIGSSGWIAIASRDPMLDPQQRIFTWVHPDPSLYIPCGTVQAAGLSYAWLVDTVSQVAASHPARASHPAPATHAPHDAHPETAYDTLNRLAADSEPGARALVFLPHLLGERSPGWNARARGAFVGLCARHQVGDLARAVLEGVAHAFRSVLDVFGERADIEHLTLIGGAARNDAWAQILSDIYERELRIPTAVEDATSVGAVACGGVGVGAFTDFDCVKRMLTVERTVRPDAATISIHRKMHGIYRAADDALAPVYDRLASLYR